MRNGGLSGKTAIIDLTRREIIIKSSEDYVKFIGGRGTGSWTLFNMLEPNVHPYSPHNILVISPGRLVGTGVPQANRTNFSSKNPITGGVGYANAGGSFGKQLKKAGFDNIIIKGKSARPVYIAVLSGGIEIKDATHLWGRSTSESEEAIKKDLNDKKVSVASIGPAGENLVFASAIIIDRGHAAGGCALASVMGSKNLKAIVAKGDDDFEIPVANPGHLEKVRERIVEKISNSKFAKIHSQIGSIGRVLPKFHETCALPVRNYQEDSWDEKKIRRIIDGISMYRKEMLGCSDDYMPCFNYIEIELEHEKKVICVGVQANAGYGFGSRFDIDDPKAIVMANALCNDLGVDIDNAATIISWAFELYEKGIINKEDCDGLELKWGNTDALLELIKKLAFREGFGNLLADGFKAAATKIGRGAEYYAMHVKGSGIIDAVKAPIAWGLGHMVSVRGARHLDGSPTAEARGYSPYVANKLWGVPTASFPCSYEGKAKLVLWFEDFKALTDALGICYFSTYWGNAEELLGPEDYAELYRAVVGEEKPTSELMLIGRKIHEIEKAFNTLHVNLTRVDDLPPPRVFIEPIRSGPYKGFKLDWSKYNKMLDEYYELHGWDKETGWQTKKGLLELGLTEVAEKLEKYGKIIQ